MGQCDYCQTQTPKNGYCPNCGTTLYTAGGKIYYGTTNKDVCGCEVAITEKYLIIRKVSNAETRGATAGRAFGLVGVLVADAASQKVRPHGFYDLRNFQKGIFPYRNNGIKKKNAIKLITNDGKDFILVFDKPGFVDGTAKVLKTMVGKIRAAIPMVEDGSNITYGEQYCINPYVTLDTFDKIKSGYTAKPRQPAPSNSYSTPTPNVARQYVAPQAPKAATAPVQNTTQANILRRPCPNCGNFVLPTSKFCSECGYKIIKEKKCLRCGNTLGENDKFCSQCGYKSN